MCFLVTRLYAAQKGVVQDISVKQLDEILKDAGKRSKYQIVDVREADELQAVSLPDKGVKHLPLSQSNTWADSVKDGSYGLDKKKPTVVICKLGGRSMKVATFLGKYCNYT